MSKKIMSKKISCRAKMNWLIFCNTPSPFLLIITAFDSRRFKQQILLVFNFQIGNSSQIWSKRWEPRVAGITFHVLKLSGPPINKWSGFFTSYKELIPIPSTLFALLDCDIIFFFQRNIELLAKTFFFSDRNFPISSISESYGRTDI